MASQRKNTVMNKSYSPSWYIPDKTSDINGICINNTRHVDQYSNLTNPSMHQFHIPQCTIQNRNVHISVLNGALWEWNWYIVGFVNKVNCNWTQSIQSMLAGLPKGTICHKFGHCQGLCGFEINSKQWTKAEIDTLFLDLTQQSFTESMALFCDTYNWKWEMSIIKQGETLYWKD